MQIRLLRGTLLIAAATLESLLLVRFVLRLLAARPDNPAVALIYQLSSPLRMPLVFLDRGQPRFGAVLEVSTLAALLLTLLLGIVLWRLLGLRASTN